MKKKIITVLLAMVMALSVTACGEKEIVSTDYEDMEDKEKDDTKETEETDADETKETEEDEKKPASGVVLGGVFEEDYDGFEFLYCEMLMTESEENEETGKKESKKLNVFIPNGEYSSVNRDTAYADDLGVSFRVSLNPYIQYEQENYTVEENLEQFLADEFDAFYSTEFKGLEISPVEVNGDSARATVSYCYYDEWNEQYIPYFCTYYLTELSNDMTVLVEVEINSEDVTGKTDGMLSELESFYGFDIEWDESAAQTKLDAFLASGDADVNMVSTGFLLFELPAGWEQDYDYGDYSEYAFAPDGDVDAAGCVISFSQEYMGDDSFDIENELQSEEDIASYTAYLEETLGEEVTDVAVSYYGETNIGKMMKISYKTVDDDYEDITCVYMATMDSYAYMIQTIALPDCGVDMNAVVEGVLASCTLRTY